MAKGIETALDECLACLERGVDLEICLARYPQLQGELRPILQLAFKLRKSRGQPGFSPEALARGRARFLAEAENRRRAAQESKQRGWWPRLSFSRGLVTAALTLVILIGLLGGGGIVSANSLPGDPLYGVKRASEKVRLLLAFDAENRAALERYFEDLRVAEVKEVVEQHRQADVQFSGPVERVEGNVVFVDGIPLQLSAASGEIPATGDKVEVVARTREDGLVEVKSLMVREKAAVSAPTKAPTLTATATVPSEEQPSSTPTKAKPTELPTSTNTAMPTAMDSPTPTALATETATVTETLIPTDTPTKQPTREPTATVVPPPQGVKVRIEGNIDEIASDHWTVGGQRILLQQATRFNLTRAQAQVGGWAVVDALKTADGTVLAEEIVVIRGPEQPPVAREFSGLIESMSEGRWTIGGHEVQIAGDTVIEGTPQVDALAHVRADQYADGRLVARRIVIESGQVVQFEGIITSISADRWVVGGQEILVDSSTQIEGEPAVGAMAQVEAVVRADGTTRARRIRVQPASASSAPSPTAAVGAVVSGSGPARARRIGVESVNPS